MKKSELWLYAVNFAVSPGSIEEIAILRLLTKTNGNVTRALDLMTKEHIYENWRGHFYPQYDSIAVHLGGKGVCGPNCPAVFIHGSASTNPIEAFLPGEFVGKAPDLLISWREVFEFIKADRKRLMQMELSL